MNIASSSHWESINTERKFEQGSSRRGLKAWWSMPASRDIFYRIADRFLKPDRNKSVLEVGCAPARRLIEFSSRYHYIPYGVEYTEAGVEATRLQFKQHDVPLKNCFFSDVFDSGFQKAQKNKFDVVVSYGFIEHFTDVKKVIEAHLNLLKPGGHLVIMIPNLRGIYTPLLRWLAPDLLAIHNLTIMTAASFRRLFDNRKIEPLFSGYYGVLNFGMLQARHGVIKKMALRMLQFTQNLANPLLRHCHRLENPVTSPYLLFVGKKPL